MKSFIFRLEFVLLIIVCTSPQLSLQMVLTDVRLVEGQPNSGRVQVQIDNSTWIDVCDDMWDDEDGRVVCRQLGFPGLDEHLRGLPIGQQSTKSATRFNCDRSDSTLSECRHVSSDMMCGSDKGAGVTCSGVITDVRLVSEPSQPNSGRVQVQINGSITWIDVCENGWDEDDGGVVCRQLGFPGLAQHLRGLPIAGQQI
ncbi:scavenger receptor cysteine-rich domain superfamily protein-like [Patiria miniata]|uniref:SRCR domain-containing protein n=1 Tax=Patiria miniata TaxID=46514 RepID=A0A913ZXA4_PATMI|nr:scavenger receptor cysteine-rich domain superfamily protein-like [Patiria miniata]